MMSVRLPESFWVWRAVRYVGLVVWIAYETFTLGQYFRKPARAPLNGISEKLNTVTVNLPGWHHGLLFVVELWAVAPAAMTAASATAHPIAPAIATSFLPNRGRRCPAPR